MLNKIRSQTMSKWILFSLFYLCIPYFLESSLVNPDLTPTYPGYEDFTRGRTFLNEENWEEAVHFFIQAVNKSHKPYLQCSNYLTLSGHGSPCYDLDEDIYGYVIRDVDHEIDIAIYRHSHFYLGSIYLHQGEFTKANFHFTKAIELFDESEDDLGLQFYKCANIINTSWIALASLTRLHAGNLAEAKNLMKMAFWTLENFEYTLDRDTWKDFPVYWKDLKERGITTEKWETTQHIILLNTQSLISSAQHELNEPISLASYAINVKDYAIKEKIFHGESEDHFALYHNRGVFYSRKGLYQEALIDFAKAIELNPSDAEIYFQRGNVFLILEENSKALDDYEHAITLDPNNSNYYHQRALAYTIMGSIDRAKLDLEFAEIKENKLKTHQNELGLQEFSKGSFQRAIAHFSRFIELNPRLAIGYQNRGSAFYQAGNLEDAINDYNEAIRLDPAQADLYQMRAIAFMVLPAGNEAEESAHLIEAQNNLLTALEINPNDAKIYQNLAASHSLMGNLDAVLDCYEKALTLTPKQDQSRLLKNLSFLHVERGEYEKALVKCEKAILLGCNDGEIYLAQGRCFFETNQYEQAIQNYDLAIQAGFDDSNVYFNRAKAYFCLHQFDKALEDATRVLNADPVNTECYKLRGLIFLSMHKNLEAYSDFCIALNANSRDLFNNDNQANNPELTLNAEGTLFITSLDGQFIYKSLLQSQFALNEISLLEKLVQINLDSFGKGLVFGLMDGGIETFKELGPFLANLLFHPIETTEELLTAIHFLFSKALEEEWETVFEALVPELKELFLTWDKIEDYHKGRLTGLFIGKNGMAALTALGAVKTFSKLKNIVIGSSKTKFSSLLKRTKPEIAPLPTSELPLLPSVPKDKGWHLPYQGGAVIGGRYYTEHALARMAPKNCFQSRAILEARAIKKSQELGHSFTTWEEIEQWMLTNEGKSFSIDPRVIPPSVVEAEIANPGSAGKIQVILNERGDVVSVCPVKKSKPINGER